MTDKRSETKLLSCGARKQSRGTVPETKETEPDTDYKAMPPQLSDTSEAHFTNPLGSSQANNAYDPAEKQYIILCSY